VSAGGDAGAPVALDGTGAAADEFRAIARRIIDDIAPPTNMAGCSARMLSLVEDALAAKDAAVHGAASVQSSES
jgi:ATP-binding protein involved in chromosome partitioning